MRILCDNNSNSVTVIAAPRDFSRENLLEISATAEQCGITLPFLLVLRTEGYAEKRVVLGAECGGRWEVFHRLQRLAIMHHERSVSQDCLHHYNKTKEVLDKYRRDKRRRDEYESEGAE